MEKKEHHGGGLSSGFLLGVIVGVIVTLLLTTKRGKRILKKVIDEGMSKVANWEDMMSDMVEEYERKPQESQQKPVTFLEDGEEEVEAVQAEEKPKPEKQEETKSSKRFFKGIQRRSVN